MVRRSLALGLVTTTFLLAACGGSPSNNNNSASSSGSGGSSSSSGSGGSGGSGAGGIGGSGGAGGGTGGTGAAGGAGGGTGGTGVGGSGVGGAGGGVGGAGGGTGGAGGQDIDPLIGLGKVMPVESGFQFTEGPQWIKGKSFLLFSDIPANRIYQLIPPADISAYTTPTNNTNGIAVDEDGFIITAEHTGRRVARMFADKSTVTIVDNYQGKKLNSPNDVIVRKDGNIYFTDPPYGLANPNLSDLGFFGVFQVTTNNQIILIAQDMPRPNGIALSPDQNKLYVDDTMNNEIRVYPLKGDGTAGAYEKFANTTGANPDGMTVDELGNVYVATTAGIEVFRSDGLYRGAIPVPEKPTNCAFGGDDRLSLYITAQKTVYRLQMQVPGLY